MIGNERCRFTCGRKFEPQQPVVGNFAIYIFRRPREGPESSASLSYLNPAQCQPMLARWLGRSPTRCHLSPSAERYSSVNSRSGSSAAQK